jgi:hypothetical protein
VGFINPTLYTARNSSDVLFNDIVTGNNKWCEYSTVTGYEQCTEGFYCSTGWDPVTGWGSLTMTSLATLFNASVDGMCFI